MIDYLLNSINILKKFCNIKKRITFIQLYLCKFNNEQKCYNICRKVIHAHNDHKFCITFCL